jgi:hypothetical protein
MRIGGSLLLLWILATAQFVEGRASKVLSFEISRKTDSGIEKALRPRDGSKSFTEAIANIGAGNGYTANVSVGTPPQPLILGIDTGSTDTWILSNTADICVNGTVGSCAHGTFNANKSSTVETVMPGGFDATYVDKSGASGDYITDVLSIAGNEVKDMQMGLAFKSTDSQGTLGLGYGTLPFLFYSFFPPSPITVWKMKEVDIKQILSKAPRPSTQASSTSSWPKDSSIAKPSPST